MKPYVLRIDLLRGVICLCCLTFSQAVAKDAHEAVALVSIHSQNGAMQSRMLTKEIMLLREIASTVLTNGEKLVVQQAKERPEVITIKVAVDDDGVDAISLCNRIAKDFCKSSTGQVFRLLLEHAIPSQSVIDVNGKTPPKGYQTMSIEDLRMEQKALNLHVGGELEAALITYKRLLKKYPHLKHLQTKVDELTRETDASAYFAMHPTSSDAWLTLFAELLNANAFDEAKRHIEKLPHGKDPAIYQRSLELRARCVNNIGTGK